MSMIASLVGWFRETLYYLNVLSRRNAKIIFLGLDNAGKSTLLHMLKDDKMMTLPPTLHPNCEELTMGGIQFKAFDMGGHETARILWKQYYASVDGIVFIVDAADRTRYEEAREELSRIVEDPMLERVPLAVLGNKIDIPTAASEEELRHSLGLYTHMTSGKDVKKGDMHSRPIELFMVSIKKRTGYGDAFKWLASLI